MNYNGGDALTECIESIRHEGIRDIVVVDNGSTDGSLQALQKPHTDVQIVRQGNEGFGRGVNVGATKLQNTYVLSLNPDAKLHEGAVLAMLDRVRRDETIGIVGPRIVDTTGVLYPSARRFPNMFDATGHALFGPIWRSNPWTKRYKRTDQCYETSQTVDWLSGSAMLIRRSAFKKIGGFCAEYFMYFEDVDLCWRMNAEGYSCCFEPTAEVTHVGGASTKKMPVRMQLAHHRSAFRFARRTARGPQRALLPFVAVGLVLRLVVASAVMLWKSRTRVR